MNTLRIILIIILIAFIIAVWYNDPGDYDGFIG